MDHGILEYVILHIHMINIKSNVKYTYIWIENVIYYNTYMIYPASYMFLWVTLLDDKRNFEELIHLLSKKYMHHGPWFKVNVVKSISSQKFEPQTGVMKLRKFSVGIF